MCTDDEGKTSEMRNNSVMVANPPAENTAHEKAPREK